MRSLRTWLLVPATALWLSVAPAATATEPIPQAPITSETAASPPKLGAPRTVFTLAQKVAWISPAEFAVGRWDGTVSIFEVPKDPETPPKLKVVTSAPSKKGVEALLALDDGTLVSSDGSKALAIYDGKSSSWSSTSFGENLGTVNTFARISINGAPALVAGHELGFVTVWKAVAGVWTLERTIDVRSPTPISSEFPAKNVRAVAPAGGTVVITGSEDGDLAAVDVFSGKVLARQRYDATTERGINGVAVQGDRVLVVNCPSSASQPNLYLFKWDGSKFALLHSTIVRADDATPPVFSFDIVLTKRGFFVTTEDGWLWPGVLKDDLLVLGEGVPIDKRPDGKAPQVVRGASAIAASPGSDFLVAASAIAKVFPIK